MKTDRIHAIDKSYQKRIENIYVTPKGTATHYNRKETEKLWNEIKSKFSAADEKTYRQILEGVNRKYSNKYKYLELMWFLCNKYDKFFYELESNPSLGEILLSIKEPIPVINSTKEIIQLAMKKNLVQILEVKGLTEPIGTDEKSIHEWLNNIRVFGADFIKNSFSSVFYSELLLPDIFCALLMDMVCCSPADTRFAISGKEKDDVQLTGNDYIVKSHEKEEEFWKENYDVKNKSYYMGDKNRKKRKTVSYYQFFANRYFLPFMMQKKGNNQELINLVYTGKIGKGQSYITLIQKVLDQTREYWDKFDYVNDGSNDNTNSHNVKDKRNVDKIISDMMINRLLGHRYIIELASFINKFGSDDKKICGRKLRKKVRANDELEKKINVVGRRSKEMSTESLEKESDFILESSLVSACVEHPVYWQTVFWDALMSFVEQIQDIIIDTLEKKKTVDKYMEEIYLYGDELIRFLGWCLQEVRFLLFDIIDQKVSLIKYIFDTEIFVSGEIDLEMKQVLIPLLYNRINGAEFISPMTKVIWDHMEDFGYYDWGIQEDKTLDKFYESEGDLKKNNRLSQRKSGQLYNMIAKEFFKLNRGFRE